ncbi:MAG: O-antigen polymerase [Clostridia bacterium]
MSIEVICIIVFLIIQFSLFRKYGEINGRFGHISFLFLIYLSMGFASLVGYSLDITRSKLPFSILAMVYFTVSLTIIMLPFLCFKDRKLYSIVITNRLVYVIVERVLAFGGIFSLLFYFPHAILAVLSPSLQYNRDNQVFQSILQSYGIINSIASLISDYFIVMIMLAFISFSINKKKLGVWLLIGSLSYVMKVFSFGGRDGVVYWGISFLFQFLFMKDFLREKSISQIFKIGIVVLIIISFVFVYITIIRFSVYSEPIVFSIIDYLGMQISNFSDQFQISPPLRYGGANFPVLVQGLELVGFKLGALYDRTLLYGYYEQFGLVSWVFSTFLGGLLSDFGRFGTFIFIVILSMRIFKILRVVDKTHKFKIHSLLEYILYYQFISWGVFYNRLYSANYYIITLLFLVFLFWVTQSSEFSFMVVKKRLE